MEIINEKPRRLYRSRDKKIAGVCQGLADYLNVDVTLVRVIALILLFFGGGGLIAYIIFWICVPLEPLRLSHDNNSHSHK